MISNEFFEELINSYLSTGYSMIALLNQATQKPKNGDLESYELFYC